METTPPGATTVPSWPDALSAPAAERVQYLLAEFWLTLETLPDLLNRGELLLAEENTAHLRALVLEMMLALNGIAMPAGTRHLNGYLGASQRAVLERTLVTPAAERSSWVARAVALTVIYRWYAPQLAAQFGLAEPVTEEARVWPHLVATLPDWPQSITTE